MPLSSAHPALVLPLCKLPKKIISTTAVIIGSISPDIEYFYHLRPKRTYSHLFAHAWWFDLLITIALCFIFHLVVRNPLIQNLPNFLRSRFESYQNFDWIAHFKNYLPAVLFSAFIGIYSHIIWDEFTHKNAIFVAYFPLLKTYLTEILGIKLFVYNLLQHISSIGGSLIVIAFIFSLPKSKININSNWYKFWVLVFLLTLIQFSIYVMFNSRLLKLSIPTFSILILTLISTFFIGVFVTSLWYKIKTRKI